MVVEFMASAVKAPDDLTGFAARLRALRMQKGLSQIDLAKLLKVHSNHVSRYERGETKPSAASLKSLADALGVSADYLIDGNEENAAVASMKDQELLKMFEKTERLSDEDKIVVKKFLAAFLRDKELEKVYVA